jgi:hypothetical protein
VKPAALPAALLLLLVIGAFVLHLLQHRRPQPKAAAPAPGADLADRSASGD